MSKAVMQPPASDADMQSPYGYEDLDLPPEKRELMLFHESKKSLENLRVQHNNAQRLLRELYQLRREKFSSLTNSVLATVAVSAGSWFAAGGIYAASIFGESYFLAGSVIVVIGIVLGIIKPPVEELLWKVFCKHKSELQCPHCKRVVINRD